MPTRKKTTAVEAAIPTGDVKPAVRRRAAEKPAAANTAPAAVEAKLAATPAKPRKTAAPKSEKSPAATHKSPAKRTAAAVMPAAASAFDIEAHRAEIELEAYFLWERRGGAHGSSHEDWWSAVEIVRARYEK